MKLNRIASTSDIRTLNVLLNQRCNFSCSYCYSALGRNGEELSPAVLIEVLDWFVRPERGQNLNVVFSGGGDPLISFDLLQQAILHVRSCEAERNVQTYISVVTNGSKLTDETITFLLEQDIDLVVSFDILKDVHNRQRSHYEVVAETLRHLTERHLCPGIRSTITPLNVGRMVEMVEELHRSFPKLSCVAFEAVLDNQSFENIGSLRQFYDTFLTQYFLAKQRGEELGVSVGNTIDNSIQEYQERACPGKLVLTSNASLTACSRISSAGDPHFDYFRFGYADAQGVHIDQAKYDQLMNAARLWTKGGKMADHEECERCSAKWHCGGGCLLARKSGTQEQMAELCRFTRKMVDRAYQYKLEHGKKVHQPADYPLLTILPNNTCNLRCTYCYAAKGRNGARLPLSKMLAMINWFFDSKPKDFDKPLTISFMGGGEPMMSWEEVRQAMLHAREKALETGRKLTLTIITNGTLLNDEQIGFLAEQDIKVSVSYEVLDDVQDQQRGDSHTVSRNLDRLLEAGVDVEVNTTITPMNVNRMKEMMGILIARYPQVQGTMLEPVTDQRLFTTPADMRRFYDAYLSHFAEVYQMGREHGISVVSFAYLRSIFPLDRACAGELCITADGNLTGCYCVSSPKDDLFDRTCYGCVREDGEVVIDMERYNRLMSVNVYSRPQCTDCLAKWHCGGGCFHQMESYTEPFRQEVCQFTRKFLESIITNLS